jgi:iron complex transport system substrate-binding protein
MPRIVSLIASATEIVCALGFEQHLVGRSHECDYPPSVCRLPCLTRTRVRPEASSAQIDQQVKNLVAARGELPALSVYEVDGEMLRELAPDVIVTQTQCEVCAVSLRDVERALCRWQGACPQLVSLTPNSLADVWADIERVALALDAYQQGAELTAALRGRMQQIQERAQALVERPTVACVEWLDPLMAAGNWVPELVERAGGVNLFGQAGRHAPWMTWEQLLQHDPEVIALMPCGFDRPRTRSELHLLTGHPGWAGLRAVKNGKVFATDGNAFFNRPGPRLVESLEILAELLHPATFRFGYEGTGWERV